MVHSTEQLKQEATRTHSPSSSTRGGGVEHAKLSATVSEVDDTLFDARSALFGALLLEPATGTCGDVAGLGRLGLALAAQHASRCDLPQALQVCRRCISSPLLPLVARPRVMLDSARSNPACRSSTQRALQCSLQLTTEQDS